MKYKISNNTKINCKLTNTEKSINECKVCPAKKDCKFIEQSIKKDFTTKEEKNFDNFMQTIKCPETLCNPCLYANTNNITECDFYR